MGHVPGGCHGNVVARQAASAAAAKALDVVFDASQLHPPASATNQLVLAIYP